MPAAVSAGLLLWICLVSSLVADTWQDSASVTVVTSISCFPAHEGEHAECESGRWLENLMHIRCPLVVFAARHAAAAFATRHSAAAISAVRDANTFQ
eukprot:1714654-Rhodomonas_salina.1